MINIKEVRQAYENIRTLVMVGKCIENYSKDFETLDQFITDTENLIKEHSQLEIDYNNLLSSNSLEIEKLQKENEELKKYKVLMNDLRILQDYRGMDIYWEEYRNAIFEYYKNKKGISLHDSQAIEPNVLEKIDKLQEACELHKAQISLLGENLKSTQRNLNDTKKQLAIYDKALDKACGLLADNYIHLISSNDENLRNCNCSSDKNDWKDYLLKESENTDEQENTN